MVPQHGLLEGYPLYAPAFRVIDPPVPPPQWYPPPPPPPHGNPPQTLPINPKNTTDHTGAGGGGGGEEKPQPKPQTMNPKP